MASILVIASSLSWNDCLCRLRRHFPVVAFLAMLRKVQSLDLVIFRYAQANCLIDDEQDKECAHDGNTPRDGDSDKLVSQLSRVALE